MARHLDGFLRARLAFHDAAHHIAHVIDLLCRMVSGLVLKILKVATRRESAAPRRCSSSERQRAPPRIWRPPGMPARG